MPKKSFTDASSKTSGGHCHGSARPHSTHNHIYYKMDMYIFVMYWTIIIHTVHLQLNPTMFIFLFCADQMWSSSTNFFSPIMYIYIYLHFHVKVWSLFMEGTITNNKKTIPWDRSFHTAWANIIWKKETKNKNIFAVAFKTTVNYNNMCNDVILFFFQEIAVFDLDIYARKTYPENIYPHLGNTWRTDVLREHSTKGWNQNEKENHNFTSGTAAKFKTVENKVIRVCSLGLHQHRQYQCLVVFTAALPACNFTITWWFFTFSRPWKPFHGHESLFTAKPFFRSQMYHTAFDHVFHD